MEIFERGLIRDALRSAKGNVAEAAGLLARAKGEIQQSEASHRRLA